jgi:hypothetical protein
MHRSNPRIDEGRPILRRHSHMLHMLANPGMVLGVDRGRTGDGERGDTCDGKLSHPNLLFKATRAWAGLEKQSTYSLDRESGLTKM